MKWEYAVFDFVKDANASLREPILDRLGQDGWDLVCVDNGVAYMKKPAKHNEDDV